jgi:hypothetical protein
MLTKNFAEKSRNKRTFPTAASPRSTSLTLLLGLGALAESAMVAGSLGDEVKVDGLFAKA